MSASYCSTRWLCFCFLLACGWGMTTIVLNVSLRKTARIAAEQRREAIHAKLAEAAAEMEIEECRGILEKSVAERDAEQLAVEELRAERSLLLARLAAYEKRPCPIPAPEPPPCPIESGPPAIAPKPTPPPIHCFPCPAGRCRKRGR